MKDENKDKWGEAAIILPHDCKLLTKSDSGKRPYSKILPIVTLSSPIVGSTCKNMPPFD